MFSKDELPVLQSASKVVEVASTAQEEGQLETLALMINRNANMGLVSTPIAFQPMPSVLKQLQDKGYEVKPNVHYRTNTLMNSSDNYPYVIIASDGGNT